MTYLLASASATAGFLLGSLLTKFKINSQPWSILKWSDEVLGYRSVPPGVKIYRGDRVMMSLNLDTSSIPKEGLEVE